MKRIAIAGGGAAGFFAAIACAEAAPDAEVVILEKSAHFLAKVKVSGGGRCNVTHACPDPREFAARYPRGGRALISALARFSAADTVRWFSARGVELKTEPDGRMFPATDTSRTIIDCLVQAALRAGVKLRPGCGVERAGRTAEGRFLLGLAGGETLAADRLLLATGGCRTAALGQLAVSLGHTLEPPVPSLFTFQIAEPWLRELAGVAVEDAEVSVPAAKLRERGPVLVTHWGLSGPAVLRLSAWGARWMAENRHQFRLVADWLPGRTDEGLAAEFAARRGSQPAKQVANFPVAPLSLRLWGALAAEAGLAPGLRWAALGGATQHRFIQRLRRREFAVTGKSLNKDEFVTCGGVKAGEVDFRTMESRVCPGLFLAGELLDVDGVTGGFNFQAAWTTGWLAGRAMGDLRTISSA